MGQEAVGLRDIVTRTPTRPHSRNLALGCVVGARSTAERMAASPVAGNPLNRPARLAGSTDADGAPAARSRASARPQRTRNR